MLGEQDCPFRAELMGLSQRLESIGQHVTVPSDVRQAPVVFNQIGCNEVALAVPRIPAGIDPKCRHLLCPSKTRGRLSKWYVPVGQAIRGSNPSGSS
jgi:hypothetical protein